MSKDKAVDKQNITSEEALKVLKSEQEKKIKACSKEIEAVCKKYNCAIEPSITVTMRGNVPNLNIVPLKEK